jgi:plastocyanin
MRILRRSAACLILAIAAPVAAEDATGRITGTVTLSEEVRRFDSDTIVYVVGYSEPAPDTTAEVHQRDLKFIPPLIAVTAGQEVSFPNDEDEKLHNVNTPSPSNKIDLGTYPPGETRKTRLSTPGVLEFYCNIHPMMAVTVLVVPNRRFTITASDGSYEIDGVRPGKWSAFAYHRGAIKPARREVEVVAGETAQLDFELTQALAPAHMP